MLSLGVDSRRMTGRDPPRFEDSKSKGRPFKGGNEANSAMFAHDVRCRTSLPSRWRDQLPLVGVYAAAWVHRCRVIAPVERIQICVCESDCLWLGARLYDLTGLRPSTMLVFALAILSRRIFSSLARGCAPLLPFSREHSSAGPRRYWPRQGDRLWRRTWHH